MPPALATGAGPFGTIFYWTLEFESAQPHEQEGTMYSTFLRLLTHIRQLPSTECSLLQTPNLSSQTAHSHTCCLPSVFIAKVNINQHLTTSTVQSRASLLSSSSWALAVRVWDLRHQHMTQKWWCCTMTKNCIQVCRGIVYGPNTETPVQFGRRRLRFPTATRV